MQRSDFVRRHEAAFRDFHIFLVGALHIQQTPCHILKPEISSDGQTPNSHHNNGIRHVAWTANTVEAAPLRVYRFWELMCNTRFCSYVCWLVGCLTSQQHVCVSQGRICSDNFTCCHTEIEVADQTFYLTQSQYTDTRPTSPSADPITPGAWQGSHWSASF